MTVDPFGCRCPVAVCTQRATQEDMLCDVCRVDHAHAVPADYLAAPSAPFAQAEPIRLTFDD